MGLVHQVSEWREDKTSDDFAPKGLLATILGLRPLFCAPQGLQNSAQGFNPGFQPWESSTKSDAPLKGRQIERPNKAEAGSDGPIFTRPNCAL
jgi:hypothetical protein